MIITKRRSLLLLIDVALLFQDGQSPNNRSVTIPKTIHHTALFLGLSICVWAFVMVRMFTFYRTIEQFNLTNRLRNGGEINITACHEAGHVIVAYYTKESMPVHTVTIIPRGLSLGHTAYMPRNERSHATKAQLLAMMDTAIGGRAAEELIFGPEKIASGASDDLKKATSIANNMVKELGMSKKVGLRNIEEPLGQRMMDIIDAGIKKILTDSYERAELILKNHSKEHMALAEALLRYQTLDAEDIEAIITGNELQ